jgi:hypothetical protein
MTENFIHNVVAVLSLKQIGHHFVRHPVVAKTSMSWDSFVLFSNILSPAWSNEK